ncbi:DUF4437 domain-containing protein [uncultured Tateyamaria sp.]|uniref:DUF4437 domain-containing protein n=1 Tax=uncultured Tateyamaria sp. TaxID=455651 RepID=UPI0026185001|nr:DUF4437 domain-containing protein [uncultured Tateyamaria sp.]
MTKFTLSSLAKTSLATVTLFIFVSAQAVAEDGKIADSALPIEDKEFLPAFPGDDTINFARAYGNRNGHAHGTFGRFPANFVTPPHTHSHSYRAVVLSGEMTNPFKGEENPPVLKPGAFWSVAAGSIHTTACVSDTPCEFFMYSDQGFDFKPSE